MESVANVEAHTHSAIGVDRARFYGSHRRELERFYSASRRVRGPDVPS